MRIPCSKQRGERGSAFIMVLALIVILLVILAANDGSISSLRRELRATEAAQQRHWRQVSVGTNAPAPQPARAATEQGGDHD